MAYKKKMDITSYLVIGPENTKGRPVAGIIKDAVMAGFTCVQIRSKTANAKELISLTAQAAEIIASAGKTETVTLLVDDRLDVVLSALRQGVKVDGIHVGQSDIPVDVCREYLGNDLIIGVSARTDELADYLRSVDTSQIDYFGIGPLHETSTKSDCGRSSDGKIIIRSFNEIEYLVKLSPLPLVVGGGVKKSDLPQLAKTGVAGFFVVTAVTEADNPEESAKDLVNTWLHAKGVNHGE